jgi:nitroreductase
MGNNATEMMAESIGFDTTPMEGFDAAEAKREFGIPADDEVVGPPAIGRAHEPDKAYPCRFSLEKIVFSERYGVTWTRRE